MVFAVLFSISSVYTSPHLACFFLYYYNFDDVYEFGFFFLFFSSTLSTSIIVFALCCFVYPGIVNVTSQSWVKEFEMRVYNTSTVEGCRSSMKTSERSENVHAKSTEPLTSTRETFSERGSVGGRTKSRTFHPRVPWTPTALAS